MFVNNMNWIVRSLILIVQLTFVFSASLPESNNACDNFYNYACKSQANNPDNTKFKSLVSQAQEKVAENLKHIIQDVDVEKDIAPLQKLKTFYDLCINQENVNSQGVQPIKSILNSLGGWPIISKSSDSVNSNYRDLLSFYGKLDVFPLYKISTHDDVFHGKNKILIHQPKTAFLNSQENLSKYVNFIKNVAKHFDATNDDEKLQREAEEIAGFEANLMKILLVNPAADVYQPQLVKVFQNKVDPGANKINVADIINSLYSGSTKFVNDEAEIDVASLDYYSQLISLLQNTPVRTIVNYIHWRFVVEFLPYTNNEVHNLYSEVSNILPNSIKEQSRHSKCASESIAYFNLVIAYQYAKKYLSAEVDVLAHEIIGNVKKAAIEIIKQSTLLKEEEKTKAESKVTTMSFELGVLESMKDLSSVLEFYNSLVNGNNYFDNILNLRRFSKVKELEKTKINYSDDNKYGDKLLYFNEPGFFYNFLSNKVYLKVENLIAPLLDVNHSESKKYGLFGYIVARNIMYAFESSDSMNSYVNGRLEKLYSEETKEKYWNKMECFISQFTNIQNYYSQLPEGIESDPSVNNIGDTAAIRIALKAYHDKVGTTSSADDKEFFTSFANLLCRPELTEFSAEWMLHLSKPEYRIQGSLPNVKEFAEAYSCPAGSRMNPANKCSFWN